MSGTILKGSMGVWHLICISNSAQQGFRKSTRAMCIAGAGVLVKTSTRQDSSSASEALAFLPNTFLEKQVDGTNLIKGTDRAEIVGHYLTLAEEAVT